MSSFDEVKGAINQKYINLINEVNKLTPGLDASQDSISNFKNISEKERAVIDKINEMSKTISCYKVKEYNDNNPDYRIQEEDYCYDSTLRGLNKDDLNNLMKNYSSDIDALINHPTDGLKNLLINSSIRRNIELDPNSAQNTDGSLNVVDGESIEDVLTNYNNLQSNRNKLKTTLSELKSEKGTFSRESELHLDATIYSSILFTTVATGLLYYVFTAL